MKTVRLAFLFALAMVIVWNMNGTKAKAVSGPPCTWGDGHDHNWVDRTDDAHENKAPTCTEPGYKWQCCGDPNKVTDWNSYYKVAEWSELDPYYGCNNAWRKIDLPALGHDLTEINTATCTQSGELRKCCTRCDYYEVVKKTDPLGHDFGEPQRTIKPSCKDETDGTEFYICGRCKAEKTETIKWEHNWEKGKTVEPSCVTEGYTEYTCKNCGKTKKENMQSALGHKWKDEVVIKNPTCEEDGEVEQICERCHTEGPRVPIPATGHNWDEGVVTKQPAYQVEGVRTYTCKNDPSHKKTEAIPALTSPDNNNNNDNNPTPTSVPLPTATPTPIPTIEPTTTLTPMPTAGPNAADGAPVNGVDELPENGCPANNGGTHNWQEVPGGKKEPTCTEDGYTTYACLDCEEAHQVVLKALGHDWDEGVTKDGVITYTCRRDSSHKKTEGSDKSLNESTSRNGKKGGSLKPAWIILLIVLLLLIILAIIVLIVIKQKKKGKR